MSDFARHKRVSVAKKNENTFTRECPYICKAKENHMPLPGTMVGSLLCRCCTYFGMLEIRSNSIVCKFETLNGD